MLCQQIPLFTSGTSAKQSVSPPSSVFLILLGVAWSLTAYFVKSLPFVCVSVTAPSSIWGTACVLSSRGQQYTVPAAPQTVKHHLTSPFMHPSFLFCSLHSFHSPSPGTHILCLTSNSAASSQDASPRSRPALRTIPRVMCDSRWQTPWHKPHTLPFFSSPFSSVWVKLSPGGGHWG